MSTDEPSLLRPWTLLTGHAVKNLPRVRLKQYRYVFFIPFSFHTCPCDCHDYRIASPSLVSYSAATLEPN